MKPQAMTLETWIRTVCEDLDLSDLELDDDSMHIVLDLARDAAHQVQRPAAPLTTFLVGVAVGRGRPLGAAAAQATRLTGVGISSASSAPSAQSASSASSASSAESAPAVETPSAPVTPTQPMTDDDPPRPVVPPPPSRS